MPHGPVANTNLFTALPRAGGTIYVHLQELIYVDISPETFTSPYGFTSIGLQAMKEGQGRQWQTCLRQMPPPVKRGFEAVVPNPKLKLMD